MTSCHHLRKPKTFAGKRLKALFSHLLLKINDKQHLQVLQKNLKSRFLSLLAADLSWLNVDSDWRRTRWLPEWKEHVRDCILCLMLVLIVMDNGTPYPWLNLSTSPSPNLISPTQNKNSHSLSTLRERS